MTTVSIEAQVTADHRLKLTLPDDFPTGPAKVTVEPITRQTPRVETDLSPLGQRLRAIRDAALAEGMPVMTQDEVLAEVRQRRGEPADDD
ncbi:hypothetical protein [Thiohalocapsa halophila]|jgi:hypothetical protein